jgi:hypothetical protein
MGARAAAGAWIGSIPLVALACSASSSVECHVGADCASGACDANGKCVTVGPPDAGVDASLGIDAGPESSPVDAPVVFPDAPYDSPIGGCVPKGNGTITRDEVPMQAGLHATFRVAENVTVSTAGTTQPDGSRLWDLSQPLAGDHDVVVTTDDPTGSWYASSFSGATYATRLSDTQTLLGVFQATSTSLLLQGVVSPSSGAQQTELSYSPAVTTLSFPMSLHTSWQTNANVTGTAQGIAAAYVEQYATSVDAVGVLHIPYGTFAVQRVHTVLTRTVGAVVSIIRSDAFVAECFGTVATVTSQTDEPNDEFTNAAEVRRLAP